MYFTDEYELNIISLEQNKSATARETETAFHSKTFDGYTLLYKAFTSIENAVNCLNFSNMIRNFNEGVNAWLIKLEIDENFEPFDSSKLNGFTRFCRSKSIVVFFKSKSRESGILFWKSSDIDCLLTLKPPKKKTAFEIEELYNFVADFLIFSLKDGHLGEHFVDL